MQVIIILFHFLFVLFCSQPWPQSRQFCKFFFVLIIIRSGFLAEIRWSVRMSNALKKQVYSNIWLRGKLPWSRKAHSNKRISRNYRPITCLLMKWSLLTALIREEIYYSLVRCGLLLEEQKRCHRRNDERLNHYTMINTSWRRAKQGEKCNHGVDRHQYGLWYSLKTWILECLKTYKMSDYIIKSIMEGIKTGKGT